MTGIFPSDRNIQLIDVTTNNVSTSKHGFAPKLDNNVAHFLNGQGGWTTPSSSSGACVQRKVSEVTAATTTNVAIPADNTKPQSGEGAELTTIAITPTSTSNYLEIEFSASLWAMAAAGKYTIWAIFLDSETDARMTGWSVASGVDAGIPIYQRWRVLAPSTSAQTWKIRWGTDGTATSYLNRLSSGSFFNGTGRCYLSVTEYTP